MHDRKKKGRVLALIQKLDGRFLWVCLAKCFLEAVVPYLLILLPAMIVNLLYEGVRTAQILWFTGGFFLVFLGVKLLLQIFKRLEENRRNHILNLYAEKKVEKIFSVKFEVLETAAFEKIRQGIRYNDENFGALRNYMEELGKVFQSVFQIAAAIAVFLWMTVQVSDAQAAKSLLAAIGILAAGTVLAVWLLLFLQRAVNGKMPALMDKIVSVNTIFAVLYEDVVQNYQKGKDVRLFGIDGLILREGDKMIEGFAPHAKKQIWLSQISGMAGSMVSLILGGISFAVIGHYALKGYIAPGDMISFAGSIQQLAAAVIGIAFSVGSLNLWNVRMDAVFELFALEEEQGQMGAQEEETLESIEFRDVSFRYPEGEQDILKHVSLTIRKGEKIAVVGPNGSGKSTFIKLLAGLYEPCGGEILVNGKKRSGMDKKAYQRMLAAVYQDFAMFSFTLGENVALAEHPDGGRLHSVLKKLKLEEKVRNMKAGTDTWLYQDYGEDGRDVSGGEAQKIAICRALYRDAPLAILDEPTSALDPKAEYEIFNDFQTLVEDKTAVFVSHRLSSCRFCQRIFVFEHGQAVQQGSHEELLREEQGLYRRLWEVQAQYYQA